MAYGITSESQIIDIGTIRSGCNQYISALDFYTDGGNQVIEAGSTCNAKALSVDGASFESEITQVGEKMKQLKDTYSSAAEAVYAQAVQVYNEQVAELNEYRRKLAEQQKKNEERSSTSTTTS